MAERLARGFIFHNNLSMALLEEVFKTSGTPTYTFVPPVEYTRLKVYLRSPDRGLIVEGPSGIGKTTSIIKLLEELDLHNDVLLLSARRPKDIELIQQISSIKDIGTIVIDDFHKLSDELKEELADYLKLVADASDFNVKLILIGINSDGESLIKFAADLNNRIDTIRFEKNPDEKIEQLISSGETALNISINIKHDLIKMSQGSFHLAQMLCRETCLLSDLTETSGKLNPELINVSKELVQMHIMDELSRTFYDTARRFSIGSKLRPSGRAPYLHLLKWLSESDEWSIEMRDIMNSHPAHRASINQVVEKEFLDNVVADDEVIQKGLHYEAKSQRLSIEDPKFMFYIKNLAWNQFAKRIGFSRVHFDGNYDVALSFAGSDREFAEILFQLLTEQEISTFYDKNEQHRIIASNVEEYLAPIYQSEANLIIVFIGNDYPKRIWTQFESRQFKDRFGEGSVIPVWFNELNYSSFDTSREYGGYTIISGKEVYKQMAELATVIAGKLAEMS